MTGPDYDVHGGAHGLEADLDDMDATGGVIRSTGLEVVGLAASSHGFLVDGNLLSSAPLSPGTFARFETQMLAALDGPDALSAHGLSMSAAGIFMQGKAQAYLAVDQAMEIADDVGDWAQGYTLPLQIPWRLSPAGLPTTIADVAELAQDGFFSDPQQWLLEHPDQLEELVASAPGFVSLLSTGVNALGLPLPVFPLTVEQGSAVLAGLYGQELESVTDIGTVDGTTSPADIQAALQRVAGAGAEHDQFQIEVTDGVVNVYLPGTKEFDAPWAQSDVVQNMGTNLAAVAGESNAYEEAVIRALEDMDLPPGTEINLVGHSQGGIVAARVAQVIANGETDVDAAIGTVITAGSPVDDIDVPEEVRMVSLVNEYDIVPRLDGERYGDVSNHTTIVGYQQKGSVTDNHSIASTYVDMAGDLVDSDDEEVVDALAGIDLGSGDGSLTTYQMERG